MATPILSLPTLTEGQTNSETNVNNALIALDALAALRIEDNDLTAPPGSPTAGQCYIVGGSATGDWAGEDGKVAIYNNGWVFKSPVGGLTAFVHDEKELICYSSAESAWFPMQPRWSTVEHWTGAYREGSKVYAKCFENIACPNAATTTTAHSITGLDLAKHIDFEASMSNGTVVSELNQAATSSIRIYAQVDAANLDIVAAGNYSAYTADVRLTYCRT